MSMLDIYIIKVKRLQSYTHILRAATAAEINWENQPFALVNLIFYLSLSPSFLPWVGTSNGTLEIEKIKKPFFLLSVVEFHELLAKIDRQRAYTLLGPPQITIFNDIFKDA